MSSSIRSTSPVASTHSPQPDAAPDNTLPSRAASPSGNASRRASTEFPALKPRGSTDTPASGARPPESLPAEGTGSLRRVDSTVLDAHRSRRASAASSIEMDRIAPENAATTSTSSAASVTSASTASADNEVSFTMPPPCGGPLTRHEDGRLRCEQDRGAQGVLNLLSELDPDTVRNLALPPGATIRIEWDENLMEHMSAFMRLAGGDVLVATDMLRDAIASGASAFTPQARMPGGDQHPSDFLRNLGIRVHVTPDNGTGARLQSILERQYDDPAKNMRIAQFRHDFGAMSLLSLANNKQFTKQLAYGVGASLTGTGTIGATFDYGIWDNVKRSMSEAAVAKFGPLLDSLTPLFAETFDSMVISRLLEVMKGGNFLPDNFGEAWDTLKSAAYSGAIAAIGSIANNYVRELASEARQAGHTEAAAALLVAKQFTNLLATWMSGAMIPLEVMSDHEELVDAKMNLIETGVIPRPDVADVRTHVSESTLNTIRAARGTGSAIRSMATGGEIAATIGLLLSILEHQGVISGSLEQLITLMYSTPTEVLSMTASMAAEKWVGADGDKENARITTDAGKQSAMLARISGHEATTLDDLDRIARPDGERNASLGHTVTQALGTAMGIVDKGAGLGIRYTSAGLTRVGNALSPIADIPYVSPVLTSVGNGLSGTAQFAFEHALKPLGQGVQAVSGAAYRNALKPVGQGLARAIDMASPVLDPLGKGAATVATGAGRHVVKPVANATAATFDTVVRAPGAVVGAGVTAFDQAASSATDALSGAMRRRRAPRNTEPSGPDQV